MSRRTIKASTQFLLAALVAAGCGDDGPTEPTDVTAVTVIDNSFDPSVSEIEAGQTVTWTWTGNNPHNVTFDDATLTSSATQTAGTFAETFDADGEYTYYCTVHGRAVMSGRVAVR